MINLAAYVDDASTVQDDDRNASLQVEFDGMFLDYSRQRITGETMKRLVSLANAANLRSKIKAMATGARINVTENRSVLHMALRAPRSKVRV